MAGKGRSEQVKFFLLYQKKKNPEGLKTQIWVLFLPLQMPVWTLRKSRDLLLDGFSQHKPGPAAEQGRGCVNPLILCWQENTEALGGAPGADGGLRNFSVSRAGHTAALSTWECGNFCGSCAEIPLADKPNPKILAGIDSFLPIHSNSKTQRKRAGIYSFLPIHSIYETQRKFSAVIKPTEKFLLS